MRIWKWRHAVPPYDIILYVIHFDDNLTVWVFGNGHIETKTHDLRSLSEDNWEPLL